MTSLVLLALLALLSLSAVSSAPASSSLCLLYYSIRGSIDFSYSVALYFDFTYQPTPSSASSVTILTGSGRRTYTNRFGYSFSTPFTLLPPSSTNDNLLLLSSSTPLTSSGLLLNLSSPVELPGTSPTTLHSLIPVFASPAGFIVEGGGAGVDATGSAYLSPLPSFTNVTISASNRNSLAVLYPTCQAPIGFLNGQVQPTQPNMQNGAKAFQWSAFMSDGSTFSVALSLNVTATSPFGSTQDMLGNPYQTLVNISGTRVYTHLTTGNTLTSVVSTSGNFTGRFYPYTFIAVSPGVYTADTVPHLDGDGWELMLQPPVPLNGLAPKDGTQFDRQTVKVLMGVKEGVLYETHSQTVPVLSLQQQTYVKVPPT